MFNHLLIAIIVLLNVINVIVNVRKNISTAIITILLLLIYFKYYNFSIRNLNPNGALMACLAISFLGPLMESFIIYVTNGEAWRYGHPYKNMNVPLWLFPGYGMLALSSLHIYNNYI